MTQNPDDKKDQGINLGLGALLGKDAASENVSIKQEENSSKPFFVLADLASNQKWDELIKIVEADMESGSAEAISNKLWWVRAQIGKSRLPISFLVAPFSGALSLIRQARVEVDATLRDQIKETAQQLIKKSLENGNREIVQEISDSASPFVTLDIGEHQKEQSVAQKTVSEAEITSVTFPAPTSETVVRGSKRMPLLILLGACVVGFAIWLIFFSRSAAEVELVPVETQSPEATPALIPPELRPQTGLGNLSALYYDMQRTPTATPAPTSAGTVSVPESVSNTPVPARVTINTSGPLEDREFRDRLQDKAGRESDSRQRSEVEIDGVARLPERGDERVSPSRGFQSGTYETLNPTRVYSEPSTYSRVLGRLEPGDHVLVESRLGRWLRLRSRKGRGGFVMEQDIDTLRPIDLDR